MTIEAQYTVGEYDILILSAKQSSGLETWLKRERLSHPGRRHCGARQLHPPEHALLRRQGEPGRAGQARLDHLRPIQVAYESPKFMLPIRLGMVNADGPQELFVYTLTRKGRVETTNYRTVKLPTDVEIPAYVKAGVRAVLPGDLRPARAPRGHERGVPGVRLGHGLVRSVRRRPAVADELRELGVFWLDGAAAGPAQAVDAHRPATAERLRDPAARALRQRRTSRRTWSSRRPATARTSRAATCCVTPWTGTATATAAEAYRAGAGAPPSEAQTLASLTGWPLEEIRRQQGDGPVAPAGAEGTAPWWRRLWQPGR